MSDSPYSLSELNFAVRNAVQLALPGTHQLVAEISELRESRGHAYLELIEKDDSEKILAKSRATIWGSVYRMLTPYFRSETGHDLHAGLKVLITVSVEFHEIYGYSLNIRDIDPAYTLGDIEKRKREIIQKLEEEGIMGMNAELEMPELPKRIAVISSSTAAGFGDFVDQLEQNQAGYEFHISLFEAAMQGENTDASVISAFDKIYEQINDYDLVVLIRGGGSRADLSAFDSYFIAANICQFPLPVITGIGHERDESIADLVAHTAVKTPTAAAEFLITKFADADAQITDMQNWLIVTIRERLIEKQAKLAETVSYLKPSVKEILFDKKSEIERMAFQLKPASQQLISTKKQTLEVNQSKLQFSVQNMIRKESEALSQKSERLRHKGTQVFQNQMQNTDAMLQRLMTISSKKISNALHKVEIMQQKTEMLSPQRILEKGYSLSLHNGKAVKSAKQLKKGDILQTIMADGTINSEVK